MYYNGSAMCSGGFREQRHWAMGPNLRRDERWQRGPEFPVNGIFTHSERVLTEGSSQEGGIQSPPQVLRMEPRVSLSHGRQTLCH